MNHKALAKALKLLVLLALTGALHCLFSQSRTTRGPLVASLFDEFGAVGYCDLSARLDNFAIQLQGNPKLHGYIIVYAPPVEKTSDRILESLKGYLVNTRGLVSERVTTLYGGRNDSPSQLRVQVWIAPQGAAPPEPEKYETKPEDFKGLFYEHDAWDEIDFGEAEGEGISLGVSSEGFVDVVRNQPKSIVYVVGYNGETSAPGAWRRVAEAEVNYLKQNEFGSERFKIIYGGDLKEAKVQVWIQPAADSPPIKEVGAEPLPKSAVQMGDYGELELGNTEYERAAFKKLADTLRMFPNLRACLIVRVASRKEEIEEKKDEPPALEHESVETEGDVSEPIEPDPQPADLFLLAEKWKHDLATTHKIHEDRLVVLFSKAREDYVSSLEAWVVPPGRPLPDPEDMLRDEQGDEQGEPNQKSKTVQPTTANESKSDDSRAVSTKKP